MKKNYPIRYCVLPLKVCSGWGNEKEYNFLVNYARPVCFLTLKCYLVGENIEYNSNGEKVKEYKVVPTYESLQGLCKFEFQSPHYINGKCDNYRWTSRVFTCLEEANDYKKDLNEKYISWRKKQIGEYFTYDIEEKFFETLERYKELEDNIEINTLDLNTKDQEESIDSKDFDRQRKKQIRLALTPYKDVWNNNFE